jgi:hypothetical protein
MMAVVDAAVGACVAGEDDKEARATTFRAFGTAATVAAGVAASGPLLLLLL